MEASFKKKSDFTGKIQIIFLLLIRGSGHVEPACCLVEIVGGEEHFPCLASLTP